MKYLLFLALMLFVSVQSRPALALAFFTQAEEREISTLIKEANKTDPAQNADRLTLQAIVWTNENDWMFWLNGKKWTPETTDASLFVRSVSADTVDFLFKSDSGPEQKFKLSVHQTYRFSTGEISEGE